MAGYQHSQYLSNYQIDTLGKFTFLVTPRSEINTSYNMNDINEIKWYPMRSSYGREKIVKNNLDKLGIDNYLPMTYQIVEENGKRHRELVPAIHNLIFIHSSRSIITDLKKSNTHLSSLRYMKRKSLETSNSQALILTVPINQMNNFITATKGHEEDVTYLDSKNGNCTIGQKVRITDGIFGGVEGYIKRIHKNKRVLVCVKGISSVMLNFVPKDLLKIISDGKDSNKPYVLRS